MLEAGEILEENPQRNWKISRDVANPVYVRGKETSDGGFAKKTLPKQCTSTTKSSEISIKMNETGNNAHIRLKANKFRT